MADDWATVGGGNDWQMVEPSKKFGLGDTWPAQLAKSIYSAITLPGDVYKGNAAVPQSGNGGENIDRVTNLAALGTPLAPGGPGATRMAPAALPTAGELKGAGADVYNLVKDVRVPPAHITDLAAKIENDLVANRNFRDLPVSARDTLQEVRNLVPQQPKASYWDRVQAEMNGEQLPTAPVKQSTVGDIRGTRMALGEFAKEVDNKGKATPNAAAAKFAINHIDDYLSSLAPELKAANANYAAGSSLDTLNFRKIKAEHDTQKYGTGTNLENKMRQQMDYIPNRSLSEYEQLLKNQIVEGDPSRNFLRKVGKIGFGEGASLLGHAIAFPLSGGKSLPIGIAATGARKLGEQLTKNDIADLAAAIARRSPLYQSSPAMLPSPVPVNTLRGIAGGQALLPPPTGLLGQLGLLPTRADNQY